MIDIDPKALIWSIVNYIFLIFALNTIRYKLIQKNLSEREKLFGNLYLEKVVA